jgi:hypothetical protein
LIPQFSAILKSSCGFPTFLLPHYAALAAANLLRKMGHSPHIASLMLKMHSILLPEPIIAEMGVNHTFMNGVELCWIHFLPDCIFPFQQPSHAKVAYLVM